MRWLLRGIVVLLVLVAVVAGGGYLWLRTSLPRLDGEVSVAGLRGAVEIVRDRHGIPHIYAASRTDAYFGMGYAHAQDRLWQMEMNRRIAAGRLSEVVGSGGLPVDRFLRTLGIYDAAERSLAALGEETRGELDAYAAGVNAFLDDRRGALPVEFQIMRHEPEPWRPADSIAWSKMMAWDLGGNWAEELERARLASRLDAAQMQDFLPGYPADGPVALSFAALYRALPLERMLAALPRPAAPVAGSNNWVLAGSRTETGKPLLANDPHLGLTVPSVWYFAHLEAPGLDVIGATLPAVPYVVLGRNDRIAWGYTNTNPDVQDLYIERLDPNDPGRYLTPEGARAFTEREEVIRVKGGEDVRLRVRGTRHGPVISDIVGGAAEVAGYGHVVAFAWTALREDDATARAASRLVRAGSWNEFLAAVRDHHAPQQNMVYADVDGNIGFVAPARVPVRKPDNEVAGRLPVPGWDATYDWQGFIPFDELPRTFNPPDGVIVTANNRIVPDDYPYHITFDWAPPYRARRIAELLAAQERHSVESFRAIQGDVRSLVAVELLPHLRAPDAVSERAAAARAMLAGWDGEMRPDEAAPLIFAAWLRAFTRALYADELGPLFAESWGIRPLFLRRVLEGPAAAWCDDVGTAPTESCNDIVAAALDAAVADLEARFGDDMAAWRWDAAHQARGEHRPFSQQAQLRRLFDVVVPTGGDAYTVNAAAYRFASPTAPFEQFHGASLRAIYDLDDPDRSLFVHSTGQSGNRLSPRYDDLAPLWQGTRYVPMTTRRAEVEAGALGRLRLQPAR